MATDSKPLGGIVPAEDIARTFAQLNVMTSFVDMMTNGNHAEAVTMLTGALIMLASRSSTPELTAEILAVTESSLSVARQVIAERQAAKAAAAARPRTEPS